MKMRGTRHNGRANSHGSYNPKHNDRKFDVENSPDIIAELTDNNIYWNCIDQELVRHKELNENSTSFTEAEKGFYDLLYSNYVENQNQRNIRARHKERCRTIDELRTDSKTCPEETIYQIGTKDNHVDYKTLVMITVELISEINKRYGSHYHTLDWALHIDEGTPHIHERHVFDVINKYGERQVKQEQALKELGFAPPYPDKPKGKYNNCKMSFDAECRKLFMDICKKYGLELEEEPIYGGQKYKEKKEYIIDKLNTDLNTITTKYESKQIEYQNLEKKISDTKGFIKELSEIAYDKACEALVDSIAEGVRKEEAKEISHIKNEILSSDNILSKMVSKFSIEQLDKLLNGLSAVKARVVKAVKKSFANTTTKEKITAVIAEKAKPSLLAALHNERDGIATNSKEISAPVHKKNQDQSL